MGDIEDPDSSRPSPSLLFSLLPKEFVTSRKGMLLIAEVVRHGGFSLIKTHTHIIDIYIATRFHCRRANAEARCALKVPSLVAPTLRTILRIYADIVELFAVFLNMGHSLPVTRFPLEKGGVLQNL